MSQKKSKQSKTTIKSSKKQGRSTTIGNHNHIPSSYLLSDDPLNDYFEAEVAYEDGCLEAFSSASRKCSVSDLKTAASITAIFTLITLLILGFLPNNDSTINNHRWTLLIILLILIPLTHNIIGYRQHGHRQWNFFQPFKGGARFVLFQALAWTLYGLIVACVIFIFIYGFAWVTTSVFAYLGLAGFLSQVLILISMHYFTNRQVRNGIITTTAKLENREQKTKVIQRNLDKDTDLTTIPPLSPNSPVDLSDTQLQHSVSNEFSLKYSDDQNQNQPTQRKIKNHSISEVPAIHKQHSSDKPLTLTTTDSKSEDQQSHEDENGSTKQLSLIATAPVSPSSISQPQSPSSYLSLSRSSSTESFDNSQGTQPLLGWRGVSIIASCLTLFSVCVAVLLDVRQSIVTIFPYFISSSSENSNIIDVEAETKNNDDIIFWSVLGSIGLSAILVAVPLTHTLAGARLHNHNEKSYYIHKRSESFKTIADKATELPRYSSTSQNLDDTTPAKKSRPSHSTSNTKTTKSLSITSSITCRDEDSSPKDISSIKNVEVIDVTDIGARSTRKHHMPKQAYHFFQPFRGGTKYVLLQAAAWTLWATALFVSILIIIKKYADYASQLNASGSSMKQPYSTESSQVIDILQFCGINVHHTTLRWICSQFSFPALLSVLSQIFVLISLQHFDARAEQVLLAKRFNTVVHKAKSVVTQALSPTSLLSLPSATQQLSQQESFSPTHTKKSQVQHSRIQVMTPKTHLSSQVNTKEIEESSDHKALQNMISQEESNTTLTEIIEISYNESICTYAPRFRDTISVCFQLKYWQKAIDIICISLLFHSPVIAVIFVILPLILAYFLGFSSIFLRIIIILQLIYYTQIYQSIFCNNKKRRSSKRTAKDPKIKVGDNNLEKKSQTKRGQQDDTSAFSEIDDYIDETKDIMSKPNYLWDGLSRYFNSRFIFRAPCIYELENFEDLRHKHQQILTEDLHLSKLETQNERGKQDLRPIFYPGYIDPILPHMFCFHPHGIYPATVYWATRCATFFEKYASMTVNVLGASVLTVIPIVREIFLWSGGKDVSKRSILSCFKNKNSVILVPGGQREMRHIEGEDVDVPRGDVTLYAKHLGFIRLAMQSRVPIVPVISFGENIVLRSFTLPKLQMLIYKVLNVFIPMYPHGRYFTQLPTKVNISLIYGEPMLLPYYESPSEDILLHYHHIYYETIRQLFEQHKCEAGYPDAKLHILY